jgi:hypothetical protein
VCANSVTQSSSLYRDGLEVKAEGWKQCTKMGLGMRVQV